MKRIIFFIAVVLSSTVFGQTADLHGSVYVDYIDKCDVQSAIPVIPGLIAGNLLGDLWKYDVQGKNVTVSLNGSVIQGQSRLKEFETNGVASYIHGVFKDIPESEKSGIRRYYGIDVTVETNQGAFLLVNASDKVKLASLYVMDPAMIYFPKFGGQPGEVEGQCVIGLMRAIFDPNDYSMSGPFQSVSIAMISKDSGAAAPFAGINQLLSTAVAISATAVSLPTN
jgi:hypothetical protein